MLPASVNVKVLDISPGGVMLGTTRAIELGTRGQLRVNLAGASFTADVQVQRVSSVQGSSEGYTVGAMFVGLDVSTRQVIEQFMTKQ